MDSLRPYGALLLKGWASIPPLLDRVADWADRLDWDGLAPAACVGGALLFVWSMLLFMSGSTDRRTAEFWSSFAVAGRWVALGVAVTPVVVWAASRR